MLCLDGCGKLARARGLATGCYQKLNKQVIARETSWKKLIDSGMALRAKKKGWVDGKSMGQELLKSNARGL